MAQTEAALAKLGDDRCRDTCNAQTKGVRPKPPGGQAAPSSSGRLRCGPHLALAGRGQCPLSSRRSPAAGGLCRSPPACCPAHGATPAGWRAPRRRQTAVAVRRRAPRGQRPQGAARRRAAAHGGGRPGLPATAAGTATAPAFPGRTGRPLASRRRARTKKRGSPLARAAVQVQLRALRPRCCAC